MRGLLTGEEVLKAVKAGFDGYLLWYITTADGDWWPMDLILARTSAHQIEEGPTNRYAPAPGYWLPMAAVPKDQRDILVRHGGTIACTRLASPDGPYYAIGDDPWVTVEELGGWQPVVDLEES